MLEIGTGPIPTPDGTWHRTPFPETHLNREWTFEILLLSRLDHKGL
jgi:hypothetical protein